MFDLKKLKLSNVKNNTDGNILIMSAVVIPVLLMGIGLAVDVTNLHKMKSELSDSADAAMMFGARAYKENEDKGRSNPEKFAREAAIKAFKDQTSSISTNIAFDPVYFEDGNKVIGESNFRYSVPLFFAGIMTPKKTSDVTNNSDIIFDLAQDASADITFLIDNSASLGVGATPADQRIMQNGMGCAFACHLPNSTFETPWTPERAAQLGAKLRIESVREAVTEALTQLKDNKGLKELDNKKAVRVSVYTFSNSLTELVAPTTNINKAIRGVKDLYMASEVNTDGNEYGGTIIRHNLQELRDTLRSRKQKDNKKDQGRTSYVVFLSDGIEDKQFRPLNGGSITVTDSTGTRNQKTYDIILPPQTIPNFIDESGQFQGVQVFNPDACDYLKSDGHTLYSVQTVYDVTNEMRSVGFARPKADYVRGQSGNLERAFKECGTGKDFVFQTNEGEEIKEEFKNIADDIADQILEEETLRFTQ